MPTLAQIEAASGTLTATAQAQLLALIRTSRRYKQNISAFETLADVIADATTLQAQQLNAALALVDEVGDGTVALTGGQDAVDYSQDRDREQLLDYILSVLYEPAPRTVLNTVSIVTRPGF